MGTRTLMLALMTIATAACGDPRRSMSQLAPPPGDAEHGRTVFVDMRCHACHRVAGENLADWLRGVQHEFLLGADLLVHVPALSTGSGLAGLADDAAHWPRVTVVSGGNEPSLPTLHVRAGAIVPLGPVTQFAGERPLDEVELLAAPDANGRAAGWLYEDAGDGYGYEAGEYRRTRFTAETADGTLRVRIASTEGAWPPPAGRTYRVTVVGAKPKLVEGP